jgi:hypothetical protein
MSPTLFPFPSAFRCEAAGPAIDPADHAHDVCGSAGDPATLIGLALSFARLGATPSVEVPQLLLDRLAVHARHGNPTCRLVLDFLFRRSRTVAVENAVRPDAAILERQRVSNTGRRRSQRDRVMAAVASLPPVEPTSTHRHLKRKRREPLAEIISPAIPKSNGETSHG